MAYISDYRDGSVSLMTGTRNVVGDGTAWASIGLQVPHKMGVQSGDMFMVGGFVALIEAVVDDTHITLRDDWGGPTLPPGTNYSIKFAPDQTRVQASTVALINRLSNGNIDALSELTLEADRLIYADGPNSLALATLTAYARGLLSATDAASMMEALGASAIGQALLTAVDPSAAQDAIGATAVGKALLTAADEAAGRTAIGAADAAAVAAAFVGVDEAFAGVDAQLADVDAALAKRLRVDGAQGLTAPEQLQARTNMGAQNASNLTEGTLHNDRVSTTLPADKAFRRGNILGTVSQAGGVPTGAIVERGSNANGEYVRFADGTQICTRVGSEVATTAIHNGFNYLASGRIWSLPAAFAAEPVISGGCRVSGNVAWFSQWDSTGEGTVSTIKYSFVFSTPITDSVIATRLVAIGRWF